MLTSHVSYTLLTSSEVVWSKLSSLASAGMMLEVWIDPRTANLVAPCCLSHRTRLLHGAQSHRQLISDQTNLSSRVDKTRVCDYCDEPGDGLRAALSYLINQSINQFSPKFDLRQLPGTLARSISIITNPSAAHLATSFQRCNHGCRPVAQGPRWPPSTSG